MTRLCYMANAVINDDLMTQGATASAYILKIFTRLFQNISALAPDESIRHIK